MWRGADGHVHPHEHAGKRDRNAHKEMKAGLKLPRCGANAGDSTAKDDGRNSFESKPVLIERVALAVHQRKALICRFDVRSASGALLQLDVLARQLIVSCPF